MSKKIVVVGTFDTKGTEYKFVVDLLRGRGYRVITVNVGVMGSTNLFPIDIASEEVARAGGMDLAELRAANDRGKAIAVMSDGITKVISELYSKEAFDGIIGMGGTAGTHIVTTAMRELSFGMPKICVSTVASGNVANYIGTTDIILIPSITDISGINAISKISLTNAAAALTGTLDTTTAVEKDKPVIAASMFGNTTRCVDRCRALLTELGFEVLVFHASGTGGKAMEKLVNDKFIDAVLDITTTEWADTLCGGVFDAGPERLDAPGRAGIPHLIVPGCIDMCNFGAPDSVKPEYRDRLFYQWNPNVTLMRTTAEENRKMGEIFAQKANAAKGKVAFMIPAKGYSMLDSIDESGKPGVFWDPDADRAFVDGLRGSLNPSIEVTEIEANINDGLFAEKAVEKILEMIGVAID